MSNQQEIDKKFLYKQNKQLRLQLKECQELLRIHKVGIYNLSQPYISQSCIISTLLNIIDESSQSPQVNRLNQQILELQSHQMVLQKIVEQADSDEKQTYHLLAEEYNKIKQDNQRLEGQLHKFYQKIGEVDYLSGLVTKYKEVILPSEQAIAFKKQQDQLLEFILMQKEAIRKLTEEKNKLFKINIHMKQSVQKHKDEVRNMTMILTNPDMLMNMSVQNMEGQVQQNSHSQNILDELNDQQNGQNGGNNSIFNISSIGNTSLVNVSSNRGLNTTMNFIKMQRKIIKQQEQENIGSEQDSEQEYDCPELNILFPDKVEKIKKDQKITKVPYLNMMKIRELMSKRDIKIRKQIEAENRHINPTDKIIKLETELDITRKQLTSQTLKFRTMSEQLKQALKINEELVYRCQSLGLANQKLAGNYRNMYKDYQFTKIIALRVQKAMSGKFELGRNMIEQINTTTDFDQKLFNAENAIRKVLGRRAAPQRSQSLGR